MIGHQMSPCVIRCRCQPKSAIAAVTAGEAAPQLSAYGKPTSFSAGVPKGSRPLVYPCRPLRARAHNGQHRHDGEDNLAARPSRRPAYRPSFFTTALPSMTISPR